MSIARDHKFYTVRVERSFDIRVGQDMDKVGEERAECTYTVVAPSKEIAESVVKDTIQYDKGNILSIEEHMISLGFIYLTPRASNEHSFT